LKRANDSGKEGAVIHFIEDRFETLLAVANTNGLEDIKLYLADWGYNTEEQRALAKNHDRIILISQDDFYSLAAEINSS
jgi:hypothetical protein